MNRKLMAGLALMQIALCLPAIATSLAKAMRRI